MPNASLLMPFHKDDRYQQWWSSQEVLAHPLELPARNQVILRTHLIHLCLERQRSGAHYHKAAHSLSLGCWRQGPLTGLLALHHRLLPAWDPSDLRLKAICLGCALWCRNVWAWALHHKAVLLRLSWREFSVKKYIYTYIYLFISCVCICVCVYVCVYMYISCSSYRWVWKQWVEKSV